MSTTAMEPTRLLAVFAAGLRYDDLTDAERRAAGRHLLDTIGACLSGASSRPTRLAAGLADEIGRTGNVPVPGLPGRYDVLTSAWLCGTSAHGLEVDDGYRAGSVHPGAVVVPAVLAAAFGQGMSGERMIAAIAVGYEFSTRLAEAIHPASRLRGFHNTPVVGVLAAAAAVGSLRGQSADCIEQGLGIAASSAAGLFAFLTNGGEIKRLHAGFAAREGLQAALLAERGMTGPTGVLESADGFFQAYGGQPITEGPPPAPGRRVPQHHPLLSQALCLLPPYSPGGRRRPRYRPHRALFAGVRSPRAGKHLCDRGQARASWRLGRYGRCPDELPVLRRDGLAPWRRRDQPLSGG